MVSHENDTSVIFESRDKRQETEDQPFNPKAKFSLLDVSVKCLVCTMMEYNDIISVGLGV